MDNFQDRASMKNRKISPHTKLEIPSPEFIYISQRILPKGGFDKYVKIDRAEAKKLVKHLLDWLLEEEENSPNLPLQ